MTSTLKQELSQVIRAHDIETAAYFEKRGRSLSHEDAQDDEDEIHDVIKSIIDEVGNDDRVDEIVALFERTENGHEWQPIETAPLAVPILLYGLPKSNCEDDPTFAHPVVCSGYWDPIDQDFCLTGSSWLGHFVEATHWMPLPEPPRGEA